jgi:hypothetical protein
VSFLHALISTATISSQDLPQDPVPPLIASPGVLVRRRCSNSLLRSVRVLLWFRKQLLASSKVLILGGEASTLGESETTVSAAVQLGDFLSEQELLHRSPGLMNRRSSRVEGLVMRQAVIS